MPDLEDAVRSLVRAQRKTLMKRYGNAQTFVAGWANHNLTHATDVANQAAAGARELVARRKLPPQAPLLAQLAGYFHDDVQLEEHFDPGGEGPSDDYTPSKRRLSPRREELSAVVALAAMRDHESRIGKEVFSDFDRSMVRQMIEATKVVHRTGTRLVQNTSVDEPAGAVLADADLSQFGRVDGIRQSVHLLVENEWLQGRRPLLASHGTARDLEPSHERTVAFLADQRELFRDHEYLLDQSRRMFPHQQVNAARLESLHGEYARHRLGWNELVDRTGPWARGEVSRRVRTPGRADSQRQPRDEPRRSRPEPYRSSRHDSDRS